MKRISVIAIASLLMAGLSLPAQAQKEEYGNSGTITGDDPRSFFGSGANIDPDAMEDASVPVDRATHLDPEYPGQKQIYPTVGTRGASTYPIQLPNRPNVSPGTQASSASGNPAVDAKVQDAYKYDMAQGNGADNSANNANGKNQKQKKHKGPGFLKWYAQSWKHFFLSSGNILGFPVGTDDDGTGDLKPPDMYGNN
ncbi:MAG TPA: hypothetical protein PKZ32_02495 [Candidatus Melainabacteria bacterium]|nr:hypothetical protein [Candidatus Melainabacteria bacterium]